MFRLVTNEINKIFRYRVVYLGTIIAVVFGLMSFSYAREQASISAYDLPILTLANLTQTYLIVFTLGFCAFIFGLEIEEKTLKIIRAKTVPPWKFILSKYITGTVYTFIQVFTFGIVTFGIALLCYKATDFYDYTGSLLIDSAKGVYYIFLAYLFQAAALIFIMSLSITLTVIFNSPAIAFILTFITIFLSLLAGNIEPIAAILPTGHFLVWQNIIQKEIQWRQLFIDLSVLAGYSIALFFTAVIVLNKKEITN